MKKIKTNQILSLYQILGAVALLILLFLEIPATLFPALEYGSTGGIAFLFSIILYTLICVFLGIYGGIFLWKDHRRGFLFSSLFQFTQLFAFSAFGWAYSHLSNLGIFFLANNTSASIDFNFGYNLYIWNDPTQIQDFYVGINIIAALLLVYLWKQEKKCIKKTEK